MKATVTLIQRNSFDALLESGDTEAIKKMLSQKETAIIQARTNATSFRNRNQLDYADNEQARVELLQIQIDKLKNAL